MTFNRIPCIGTIQQEVAVVIRQVISNTEMSLNAGRLEVEG